MNMRLVGVVIVLVLMVGTLVCGVVVLMRGIRGRRKGDRPHCVKCEFDLSGLLDRGSEGRGVEKCPECGSDLRRPRAVGVGVRQPRRRAVVLGLIGTLAPIALLLLGGYTVLTGPGRIKWYPEWLLLRQVDSPSPVSQSRAIDEIIARMRSGDFDGEQVSLLVDRALKAQADRKVVWNSRWGDLVYAAEGVGHLSDGQRQRFVEQIFEFELEVRKKVAVDRPLCSRVNLIGCRGATSAMYVVDLTEMWFEIEGEPSGQELEPRTYYLFTGHDWDFYPESIPLPPSSAGKVVVCKGDWRVKVSDRRTGSIAGSFDVVRARAVNVLPPGVSTVEHEEYGISPEEMVKAFSVTTGGGVSLVKDDSGETFINMIIVADKPAVGCVFDVVIRDGETGQSWTGDRPVSFVAGTKGTGISTGTHVPGFAGKSVDIVLRSAPDAAEMTVEQEKIWKGEIVFEDVPVQGSGE